ncbi:MAG TPA: thiamine phosphate synthase [Deltaproteobacteria bacterium]|nr:thiamine phosphate synthase [Deltaproteobacteria bacterium]
MTPPELLAITPGDHLVGRDLRPWLVALGAGGLPGVLIREPQLDRGDLLELIEIAVASVAWVAVHARHPHDPCPGLPLHLHASALRPTTGRSYGRSCHSPGEVDEALAAGASWALWSPVWSPASKPDDTRPPIGPDAFLSRARGRPVLALGGVTPERFGLLRRGEATGAAVLGGVFAAADPASATEQLRRYLSQSPRSRPSPRGEGLDPTGAAGPCRDRR